MPAPLLMPMSGVVCMSANSSLDAGHGAAEAAPRLHARLVIEGEIPTTHIIGRLIGEAAGNAAGVCKLLVSNFLPSRMQNNAIPLLIRVGDPSAAPMVKWMLRRKMPYLYYIDDNFWELQGEGPLIAYYQAKEVRETLELVVRNAHTVIVNSPHLGKYLRDRFEASVIVLPAPFDFSLLSGLEPPPRHEHEVRIGFAGSATREKDFIAILPALEQVLAERPQVTMHFFGYCPPSLHGKDRVVYHAHMGSYEDFIRFKHASGLDIGLAPMADTESNRYKTNNKYREYGALGITGVYADSPPYRDSVENGVNGLLVRQDARAWYQAIVELVDNPQQRAAIAAAAYEDVRQHYAQDRVAMQWRGLLEEFQRSVRMPRLSRAAIGVDTCWIRGAGWLARQKLRVHLRYLRARSMLVRVVRNIHSRMEGGA
ncbi:Glycosyltransferase-like protein (fragment) [Cupriavidus taiwanensis]|uniref:Glycosyltransferase-like protein n=2 Tax=Cupriavidus taiwanensis TaxID=164546 RepID=A0A9Q7UVS7_9BURK